MCYLVIKITKTTQTHNFVSYLQNILASLTQNLFGVRMRMISMSIVKNCQVWTRAIKQYLGTTTSEPTWS